MTGVKAASYRSDVMRSQPSRVAHSRGDTQSSATDGPADRVSLSPNYLGSVAASELKAREFAEIKLARSSDDAEKIRFAMMDRALGYGVGTSLGNFRSRVGPAPDEGGFASRGDYMQAVKNHMARERGFFQPAFAAASRERNAGRDAIGAALARRGITLEKGESLRINVTAADAISVRGLSGDRARAVEDALNGDPGLARTLLTSNALTRLADWDGYQNSVSDNDQFEAVLLDNYLHEHLGYGLDDIDIADRTTLYGLDPVLDALLSGDEVLEQQIFQVKLAAAENTYEVNFAYEADTLRDPSVEVENKAAALPPDPLPAAEPPPPPAAALPGLNGGPNRAGLPGRLVNRLL